MNDKNKPSQSEVDSHFCAILSHLSALQEISYQHSNSAFQAVCCQLASLRNLRTKWPELIEKD